MTLFVLHVIEDHLIPRSMQRTNAKLATKKLKSFNTLKKVVTTIKYKASKFFKIKTMTQKKTRMGIKMKRKMM